MNVISRKSISILLIVCLSILSLITPSLAFAGVNYGGLNITYVSDNEVMVSDGEHISTIAYNDSGNNIRIDVKNSNNSGYFLINKSENTLYSSYTGKTICKSDLPNVNISDRNIDYKSASSSIVKYISYHQLSDYINKVADATSIAGAILAVLAFLGFSVANPIGGIVAIISAILVIIQKGLNGGSSNHGIKVTIMESIIIKHHAGGPSKVHVYSVEDIGTY